jgi:hypothetical protein
MKYEDMKNINLQLFAEEPTPEPTPQPETVSKDEYAKIKAQFDKVASELAESKRKEKERMTADEKKQAELLEKEERYKAIERENTLIKLKAKVSKAVEDDTIATQVAELMADGKIIEAIEKQNEYIANMKTNIEKKVKEDLLKTNPQPRAGDGGDPKNKKSILDYSMEELNEMKTSNPTLYKKILMS